MRKIITLAMMLGLIGIASCSTNEEGGVVNENDLTKIDLSSPDALIGEWEVMEEYNTFKDDFVYADDKEIWEISDDGTMIRYYDFARKNIGTWTYDNGTLTFTYDFYGECVDTYHFSHHSQWRLKVVRTSHNFTETLLIRRL